MKKIFLAVLAIAMLFAMVGMSVGAQAENKLTTTWEQGLSKGTITTNTDTDGTEYTSATGINEAWESPFIDILGAVKSALGEDGMKDGGEIYIAFDVRVKFTEDTDPDTVLAARPLLRMAVNGISDPEEIQAYFDENYQGDLFSCDTGGNIMSYLDGQGATLELSSEWAHYEYSIYVESYEFELPGDKWNLCIDTISDPTVIAALEFKNAGVYDDTYEPVEVEEPEEPEEPTDAENPEEPAEATATPLPTAGQQTPVGIVKTTPTADAGTSVDDQDGESNTTTIIVICVVAVVVIAAIVIGIVVSKKKKAEGEESDSASQDDNAPQE